MKTGKRIRVEQLAPGMFMVGMDQPWYKTPYLLHKRFIKSQEEIEELKRHGIREVDIDPARGADLVEGPEEGPPVSSDRPDTHIAGNAPSHPGQSPNGSPQIPADALKPDMAKSVYEEAVTAMERIFEDLDAGRVPAMPVLKNIVGGVLDRVLQDRSAMIAQVLVQQMRRFDRGLGSHAIDTCILSLVFAAEYGVFQEELEHVGIGALLHDVGYLRLPRNLYRKQHQLTQQEQALMQQHPRLGQAVLGDAKDVPDAVRRIVVEHHERVDGSGFPTGLSGSALSSLGQIVGLADTYETLTSHRAGRPPRSPFEAIRSLFMLGEQRHFDKALVDVAITCLGVYPIGSVVKLNTGERAVVVGIHPEHRLKPVIKVLSGPRGELYASPREIDLAQAEQAEPARAILSALDPVTEQVNVAMYLDAVPHEGAA